MAEGAAADTAKDFPERQFPTVFSDTILNLSTTGELAKFYLTRNDPSFTGSGQNLLQPFVQVVMPLSGFLQSFAFFERTIERMAGNNAMIAQHLEAARRMLREQT